MTRPRPLNLASLSPLTESIPFIADETISPRELTLNSMSEYDQRLWAERVFGQLRSRFQPDHISTVLFHAGTAYRKNLIPLLKGQGIR